MKHTGLLYTRETQLCADFVEAHKQTRRYGEPGWTYDIYPETQGWDLLLSRRLDGFQIGIEAKLKFNLDVVNQALEQYRFAPDAPGPDCRAVLVPAYANSALGRLCAYVGITVIRVRELQYGESGRCEFTPDLPAISADNHFYREDDWFEWCPTSRLKLPAYIPDAIAGSKAPVRLTDWKVRAIKLAVLLEERPVTRSDFRHLDIDSRIWLTPGRQWLVQDPKGRGYVAGPFMPDFKAQHPRNYAEIKADIDKWRPADALKV